MLWLYKKKPPASLLYKMKNSHQNKVCRVEQIYRQTNRKQADKITMDFINIDMKNKLISKRGFIMFIEARHVKKTLLYTVYTDLILSKKHILYISYRC